MISHLEVVSADQRSMTVHAAAQDAGDRQAAEGGHELGSELCLADVLLAAAFFGPGNAPGLSNGQLGQERFHDYQKRRQRHVHPEAHQEPGLAAHMI